MVELKLYIYFTFCKQYFASRIYIINYRRFPLLCMNHSDSSSATPLPLPSYPLNTLKNCSGLARFCTQVLLHFSGEDLRLDLPSAAAVVEWIAGYVVDVHVLIQVLQALVLVRCFRI